MGLIRLLLILFVFVIIADAVLSFFPKTQNHEWAKKLRTFSDFFLNPLRKLLPSDVPFDVSPMIVVLGVLILLQLQMLIHWAILFSLFVIFVDFVISFFPSLSQQNFFKNLRQILSYAYRPIRRFLPESLKFDIAPLILLIALVAIDKLW